MTSLEVTNVMEDEQQPMMTNFNKIFYHLEKLSFTFTHVFIFSVFESIFYWVYIVPRENHALRIQLSYIKSLAETACQNLGSSVIIHLEPMIEEIKKDRQNKNIQGPFKATIYLNILLFLNSFIFVMLIGCYKIRYEKLSCCTIVRCYKRALKDSWLTLLVMIIYEVMFFEMVVSNYNPGSILETSLSLTDTCFS
jgi:hypothetical protein